MNAATARRNEKITSLTEQVAHFDMSNPVHRAHYLALREVFVELAAVMLVSQDVAMNARHRGGNDLDLTDPGAIASHPGWKARNRVVRHSETARYYIIDPEADTQVGGRLIAMFTRDQTVPAYAQPE